MAIDVYPSLWNVIRLELKGKDKASIAYGCFGAEYLIISWLFTKKK